MDYDFTRELATRTTTTTSGNGGFFWKTDFGHPDGGDSGRAKIDNLLCPTYQDPLEVSSYGRVSGTGPTTAKHVPTNHFLLQTNGHRTAAGLNYDSPVVATAARVINQRSRYPITTRQGQRRLRPQITFSCCLRHRHHTLVRPVRSHIIHSAHEIKPAGEHGNFHHIQ